MLRFLFDDKYVRIIDRVGKKKQKYFPTRFIILAKLSCRDSDLSFKIQKLNFSIVQNTHTIVLSSSPTTATLPSDFFKNL